MSLSTVQSLLSQANSAIAASNWSNAETLLLRAQTELAGIPDGGARGRTMNFRSEIEMLLKRVRSKANAASINANGLTRTSVKYETPDT